MRFDELSGMRGLKQIWHSLKTRKIEKKEADMIFERHSKHYLNRCFSDWMK